MMPGRGDRQGDPAECYVVVAGGPAGQRRGILGAGGTTHDRSPALRAILLAGGRGVRLRPLSDVRPKPLVPIANEPLLRRTLRGLAAGGVTRATVAIGAGGESIPAALGAIPGLRLDYHTEPRPLGSAGALAAALAADPPAGLPADAEPLLVCNADIVSTIDPLALLRLHRAAGAQVSLALTEVADPSRYGVVERGPDGRIRRFVEKPPPGAAPSRWVNAGVWLLQADCLRGIDPGRFSRLERGLFPDMAAAGDPIYGFPLSEVARDGLWIDVATPSDYRRAGRAALRGGGLSIDPAARVDPPARIEGDVRIAAGVVVGAGARLRGPLALGRGCHVGAGSALRDCLLWEDVVVGAGARLRGCIIADGAAVAPGERLRGVVRSAHAADVQLGAG